MVMALHNREDQEKEDGDGAIFVWPKEKNEETMMLSSARKMRDGTESSW